MGLIMCGESAEEIMAKLQDGRAYESVYEYLVKLRDHFDMDDGRLCRENVTDYFEIDCPDEYVCYRQFAQERPSEMTRLYREVILAAWDAFVGPRTPAPAGPVVVDRNSTLIDDYCVRVDMGQMIDVKNEVLTTSGLYLANFAAIDWYQDDDSKECLYAIRLIDGSRYRLRFFLDPFLDDPNALSVELTKYNDKFHRYIGEERRLITPEKFSWYAQAVTRFAE